MQKLLLMTTIALATMAAAPAPSTQTAMAAAAQPGVSVPQQASDAGPAVATAEEKKICKLLPTSGTRFAKKACLTADEWKKVQADVEGDNGY